MTDSYNLFATNVILPSLAFLYWPNNTRTINESKINIITLTGSIVGQLLFGIIADKLGRQRLYGIELIIVLVTTLGLAQSSYGYAIYDTDGAIISTSMDIFKWVLFYRFTMGIGIGAEYPLSSVITAGMFCVAMMEGKLLTLTRMGINSIPSTHACLSIHHATFRTTDGLYCEHCCSSCLA